MSTNLLGPQNVTLEDHDANVGRLLDLEDGIIYLNNNKEALPVLISLILEGSSGRNKVTIYSYSNEAIAKTITAKFPNALIFALGNVDSAIMEGSRHAKNLGDQLASEIFVNTVAIQDLDIIVIGADRISISDRKGYSRRFTEEFWNSFISSINCYKNHNRIFLNCGSWNSDVSHYLLQISSTVVSADLVKNSLDLQITKR